MLVQYGIKSVRNNILLEMSKFFLKYSGGSPLNQNKKKICFSKKISEMIIKIGVTFLLNTAKKILVHHQIGYLYLFYIALYIFIAFSTLKHSKLSLLTSLLNFFVPFCYIDFFFLYCSLYSYRFST